MGKSRAEIQRAYRERKKKKDPKFLEKERKRQAYYRVPATQLSQSALKERRRKSREHCKAYRKKRKAINVSSTPDGPAVLTDKRRSRSADESDKLVVQFAFPQRNTNKKRSRALRKANKTLKEISSQNVRLRRKLKTVQKRCERLVKKKKSSEKVTEDMTPRSKTKEELRQANMDNKAVPLSIRKKLQFSNVLAYQIKQSHSKASTQNKQRELRKVIAGKIVKKYRCLASIHRNTGIRHCTLLKTGERRSRNASIRKLIEEKVVSYFQRDDISRCMPGKNDATTTENHQKSQNRILTDYLSNIYARFRSDHPDTMISFSKFAKLRPPHVKLTSFLSRSTCLCTIHQNMAFKLKCLHSLGVDVSMNPESTSKKVNAEEMTEMISQLDEKTELEYEIWKKVDVNGVKKMRIEKEKKSRDNFREMMTKEYAAFQSHVDRVKQQFHALSELKSNLPQKQVIVQMDFAENFVCQSAHEIQSAYWNSTSVTLHPVVAYYKDNENKLQHKSFVFVSDVSEHNARTVVAILLKLVPLLKEHIPELTKVHYWTDSPSSQYRNRFIFQTICKHGEMFDVEAAWNYFECGHGKGVCDGIGGTAKRQAADAVKQGKVLIQDATDFFKWASDNQKEITYLMYSRDEYNDASKIVSSFDCQAVPGTMKVHTVVPADNNSILVRHVSCYCPQCLEGNSRCEGWVKRTLRPKGQISKEGPITTVNDGGEASTSINTMNEGGEASHSKDNISVAAGEYVAAMYANEWYLGRVLEVDEEDQDAQMTFMVNVRSKQGTKFKWPHPCDELWIPLQDVIIKVAPPTPLGKSERFFQIPKETLDLIESLKTNVD